MKNIFFAALFAAFLTSAPLAAGELAPDTDTRLAFKYLSVNDGLSQNSVTSILQSSDGRMLIALTTGSTFSTATPSGPCAIRPNAAEGWPTTVSYVSAKLPTARSGSGSTEV